MKKIQSLIIALLILFSFSACAQNTSSHNIIYKQGNTELEGYFRKPAKVAKAPGIVIIHAWMGLGNHEKSVADKLSSLSYYALAADIYGKGVRPANAGEAGAGGILRTQLSTLSFTNQSGSW